MYLVFEKTLHKTKFSLADHYSVLSGCKAVAMVTTVGGILNKPYELVSLMSVAQMV